MEAPSHQKRLIIITGARGVVGRGYLDLLSKEPNTVCVAVARGEIQSVPEGVIVLNMDLLDREGVAVAFERVSLADISEVAVIHSVGKFKFEPEGIPEADADKDGIDDEVYKTNVETFLNILRTLLPRIEKERQTGRELKLALCGLGSISDKYQVKFWNSYTKAKDVLRSVIYNLVQENPENVRGLFVNVSTVDTENENELRPNADKTYWLKAGEIARSSLPFILEEKMGSWKQIDVFKESPLFREGYYENLEEVRNQWLKQMNGGESRVPVEITGSEVKVRVNDSTQDLFEGSRFRFK